MYFCQRSPAFLEQNKIKKVVSSDTTETTQIEIFDQEFSIDENLYCLFFQKNRLIWDAFFEHSKEYDSWLIHQGSWLIRQGSWLIRQGSQVRDSFAKVHKFENGKAK